ncbi:esterase/lipase family protein [Marinobacter caseinilyticus]|uniref:esterase/lipase family protein n=1 Tax=Marinobacter caseinilyticus TaxID=2692195 RepID=UPI00140C1372|nr:hypothetical protein [Marinobacter caseinilyticus]
MNSASKHPARWQNRTSAIVNGFFGDWLESHANPLAIEQTLFHNGQALDTARPVVEYPKRTLIVMVHGLTELETIWDFPDRPGVHYGSLLADSLEASALCLRYNSGRAVFHNGAELAQVLESLIEHWPAPVERLILLGHSMGGLLIRSACQAGALNGLRWPTLVDSCVYLGSPHDGSWLAKAAQGAADLMHRMPRDYLRVVGDVIDGRSAGIRNLSRGEVVEAASDCPPLLATARHFAISGLLSRRKSHPINTLFGDALVHESSAQGDQQPGWQLTGTANFPGVDHIRLTHHPQVLQQLKEWLA